MKTLKTVVLGVVVTFSALSLAVAIVVVGNTISEATAPCDTPSVTRSVATEHFLLGEVYSTLEDARTALPGDSLHWNGNLLVSESVIVSADGDHYRHKLTRNTYEQPCK